MTGTGMLRRIKRALSNASVPASSSASSSASARPLMDGCHDPLEPVGRWRSRPELETELARPLSVLGRGAAKRRGQPARRAASVVGEIFSPKAGRSVTLGRHAQTSSTPVPETWTRSTSSTWASSSDAVKAGSKSAQPQHASTSTDTPSKATSAGDALESAKRRRRRKRKEPQSAPPFPTSPAGRIASMDFPGAGMASPLSPPQRSLFQAARHQLAQQLATASATKRWRPQQAQHDAVEEFPSPTYVSFHQPSPHFDPSPMTPVAAEWKKTSKRRLASTAGAFPFVDPYAGDGRSASADSRRSEWGHKLPIHEKSPRGHGWFGVPSSSINKSPYRRPSLTAASVPDGLNATAPVEVADLAPAIGVQKPARKMKGSDLGRPRTVGVEEMQAYFRELEGVKLQLSGNKSREVSSSEAFLGMSTSAKTPVSFSSGKKAKKARSGEKRGQTDRSEQILSHWMTILGNYSRWVSEVVRKAESDVFATHPGDSAHGRMKSLVEEMACAVERLPRDFEAAAADYDRHVRMEKAKTRALEEEKKVRQMRMSETVRRSMANMGIPESADRLTCDSTTACRVSAAEMYSRMGEITDRDVYGHKRGRCKNCNGCDPGFICYPAPLRNPGGTIDLGSLLSEATRVLCLYCNCPPAYHVLLEESNLRFEPCVDSSASSVSSVREKVKTFEGRTKTSRDDCRGHRKRA